MKTFFILFFLIIISFASNYFTMYEFNSNQSSNCFGCSYIKEILIVNIQSLLMIPAVFLIEKFFKKIKVILYSIILSLNIFFLDLSVFTSRVSSWSTYSTNDEFIAVFYHSALWIVMSVIILITILMVNKKYKEVF